LSGEIEVRKTDEDEISIVENKDGDISEEENEEEKSRTSLSTTTTTIIKTIQPNHHYGLREIKISAKVSYTTVATEASELMVIRREIYDRVLRSTDDPSSSSSSSSTSRPESRRQSNADRFRDILTQDKQHGRSEKDIEWAAEYASLRIPFVSKLKSPKLKQKLIAVGELAEIDGEAYLFKQGSLGTAFYILVSGKVEVCAVPKDSNSSAPVIVINTLPEGTAFGEKSFESIDGLRTASIRTHGGENSKTVLLVIGKSDYLELAEDIRKASITEKMKLLKSTTGFSILTDSEQLEITNYLEPKTFHCREYLAKEGGKASDFYIISKGECNVMKRVKKYDPQIESEEKQKHHHHHETKLENLDDQEKRKEEEEEENDKIVILGRIGKGNVVGPYLFEASSYSEEVVWRETTQCSTTVSVFVLARYDIIYNIRSDIKLKVREILCNKSLIPATNLLGEFRDDIDERDLELTRLWESYKTETVANHVDLRRSKLAMDTMSKVVFSSTHHASDLLTTQESLEQSRKIIRDRLGLSSLSRGEELINRKLQMENDNEENKNKEENEIDADTNITSSISLASKELLSELVMSSSALGCEKMLLASLEEGDDQPLTFTNSSSFSSSSGNQQDDQNEMSQSQELVVEEDKSMSSRGSSRFSIEHSLNQRVSSKVKLDHLVTPSKLMLDKEDADEYRKHKKSQASQGRLDIQTISSTSGSTLDSGGGDKSNVMNNGSNLPLTSSSSSSSSDAFSLIHLFRQTNVPQSASSRGHRTHIRVMGTFSTTHHCKKSASYVIKTLMRKDFTKKEKVGSTEISCFEDVEWTHFTSFQMIPFDQTDHLLIFCRSAPIEVFIIIFE